ncbi:unnamed protein product [Brassica oleracea var. botrytis]|uniref:Uncharacterized protein n=1 Tax=Brassica oleracea TaxID=3712 RepID=A0A3P6DVB8_BRAOL|nr:unnamed protein product [Brassica oleracea]
MLLMSSLLQKIVSLNAGNVLGVEDNGPAKQMTLPYKENTQQPP